MMLQAAEDLKEEMKTDKELAEKNEKVQQILAKGGLPTVARLDAAVTVVDASELLETEVDYSYSSKNRKVISMLIPFLVPHLPQSTFSTTLRRLTSSSTVTTLVTYQKKMIETSQT